MPETNHIIDFSIIWKSIHQVATPEEQLILEDWLQRDSRHRRFYDEAKRYYHTGPLAAKPCRSLE